SLCALADAEKSLIGTVQEHHVHLGHLVEADDGIVGPRARGDTRAIEADGLLECPARGLDDAALDLIDDAVGVDDLAPVHRAARTRPAARWTVRSATAAQ